MQIIIQVPTLAQSLVDSTRHINTIIPPNSEPSVVDMIYKIDAFYNAAWTKLIWFVTITFTVVGIIVPIVMNYLINQYQKKALELSEAAMIKVIRDEIKLAEAAILVKAQEDYAKQVELLKEQIAIDNYKSYARTMAVQSNVLLEKFPGEAFATAIRSAYYYFKANCISEAVGMLNHHIVTFKTLTLEVYAIGIKSSKVDIDVMIAEMLDSKSDDFRLLVKDYKSNIDKLV
jgi:uncharacterized membrane-anchored protein YhcB (DUF1043 family)